MSCDNDIEKTWLKTNISISNSPNSHKIKTLRVCALLLQITLSGCFFFWDKIAYFKYLINLEFSIFRKRFVIKSFPLIIPNAKQSLVPWPIETPKLFRMLTFALPKPEKWMQDTFPIHTRRKLEKKETISIRLKTFCINYYYFGPQSLKV